MSDISIGFLIGVVATAIVMWAGFRLGQWQIDKESKPVKPLKPTEHVKKKAYWQRY